MIDETKDQGWTCQCGTYNPTAEDGQRHMDAGCSEFSARKVDPDQTIELPKAEDDSGDLYDLLTFSLAIMTSAATWPKACDGVRPVLEAVQRMLEAAARGNKADFQLAQADLEVRAANWQDDLFGDSDDHDPDYRPGITEVRDPWQFGHNHPTKGADYFHNYGDCGGNLVDGCGIKRKP